MKSNFKRNILPTFIIMALSFQLYASEVNNNDQSSQGVSSTLVNDPMSGSYLAQLIAGLFIVVLCIVALAWLTKKINRFRFIADDSLKVIGGLSMGSRERVVLLQVADKQLLIGVAPGRINTLHVLETPIQAVANDTQKSTAQSFSDKLKTVMAAANNKQTVSRSDIRNND